MGLIPYVGLIKPTDKIPVGSYIEDIEEINARVESDMNELAT